MKSQSRKLSPHFSFFIGIPAIVWQLLFFYLPLSVLLISSFVQFTPDGHFEKITFDKILFYARPLYLKVITSSIILAFSTAVICFVIAYPFAYYLSFKAKRSKNLLLFFLFIPFWINFLLHVYAWNFVLERQGLLNQLLGFFHLQPICLLNSLFSIVLMMVYYFLPFMVLPLYASMEKINPYLIEASLDLGASWLQTMRHILLPLSIRGVRGGFFLVLIPAFGEFAIPELMGGDKILFVGNVISLYILGEQSGTFGAAFTIVSILALLFSCIIFYKLINLLFTRPSDEKA